MRRGATAPRAQGPTAAALSACRHRQPKNRSMSNSMSLDLSVRCGLPLSRSRRRPRTAGLQLRSHAAPSQRDRNQSLPGGHAIILLDQAGWHGAKALVVPSNAHWCRCRRAHPNSMVRKTSGGHASELVVKPDFQILRRYHRPLLPRLEHTPRPSLQDHVYRATRLRSSRSLNLRIGIRLQPVLRWRDDLATMRRTTSSACPPTLWWPIDQHTRAAESALRARREWTLIAWTAGGVFGGRERFFAQGTELEPIATILLPNSVALPGWARTA